MSFRQVLARLVRAQTLIVREELFIDASRCFGASSGQIIRRHIVPNVVQPVIVQVTLMLASSLLAEASLSFLGLGVQPPEPSWGAMLARAYAYMEVAPEQMYAPGLAIVVTALAFNGLGNHCGWRWTRHCVAAANPIRERGHMESSPTSSGWSSRNNDCNLPLRCQFRLDLGQIIHVGGTPRLGIAIDIQLQGWPLFYHAMPGTTPDNADWVRRKRNVVYRYFRSSYAIGRKA